jgi:inorganic triphosphatase YgiF
MAAKPVEIELRYAVPHGQRTALLAELQRHSGTTGRQTLAAAYIDTPDRRLARAGMAWRVRREGRRWVQTLKAGGGGGGGGADALTRFEHEVPRPNASFDAQAHAGTDAGDRLLALLAQAANEGQTPQVRFRTDVRRVTRRIRTRGAVVELAFDEGRLSAGDHSLRLHELEFELVSGSTTAMLALTQRWRQRYGLVFEPRTKAERGDRLAEGSDQPAVRRARPAQLGTEADALQAFVPIVDECLDQITRNAHGLAMGDPDLAAAHVHQARVGIRRLRSALKVFGGWVPAPAPALVDGLRTVFAELGRTRDRDVLDSGVAHALAAAGAPPLPLPAPEDVPDPAALMAANATQALLLDWLSWRVGLAAETQAKGRKARQAELDRFHRDLSRRLRKWHGQLQRDFESFDQLEEPAIHALRKRVKRQRYAVRFFAPLLPARTVKRYLRPLARLQNRMGELNDLYVARDLYQALVATEPAAWFALGWLSARMAEARQAVKPALGELALAEPPHT